MAFTLSCFADEIDDSPQVQLREMALRGIGFVELRSIDGKNVSVLSSDELSALKSQLDAAGAAVSAIGSPIGKIGVNDDFEPHFEVFTRLVDAAKLLNTRYIRIFSFYVPAGDDPDIYFDGICRKLARMIDYAKTHGVVLLHENEKGIYGDVAPRCKKLFERLCCDSFKATFDPANFVQCGQPVMQAYEMLRDYVAYVHIKDARFCDGGVVPAGYGDGELPQLLDALKDDGYDGFLSLEPHLGAFKGFAGLERGREIAFSSQADAIQRFGLAVDSLRKLI